MTLTNEQRAELARMLEDVAIRLDNARSHACAGWDCATCAPAQCAADIRAVIGDLDPEAQS